jgi:lipoprotein-anchoring transpeptidase ErfK/SrfK
MKRSTAFAASLFLGALVTAADATAQRPRTPAKPTPAPSQPTPATPTSPGAETSAPDPASKVTSPEKLGTLDEKAKRALAVQVALDRAGFSPGQIDASTGNNTERAWRAFQETKGLRSGSLNDAAAAELGEHFTNPVTNYSISDEDVAGPFAGRIPVDMMEKAELPALAYESVLELLAERFHASPKLLQRLNPNAKFARGEDIVVPNVEPFIAPGMKPRDMTSTAARQGSDATPAAATGDPAKNAGATKAGGQATRAPAGTTGTSDKQGASKTGKPAPEPVTVTVTDSTKTLQVQNAAGETILHAPVTVGSTNDPLPVGEWKVNGVSVNPPFNYNPKLFWDADPKHAKAKIAPGPNNPVGVVWIDLSKEHYGIHGTPEPSRIGYTESHGCIRLTNWDAMRLAALVAPGTKVVLR